MWFNKKGYQLTLQSPNHAYLGIIGQIFKKEEDLMILRVTALIFCYSKKTFILFKAVVLGAGFGYTS